MTSCAACFEEDVVDPVGVRGLYDAPGVVEVCRNCIKPVLRRGRLHPTAPTLHEELDRIFAQQDDPPPASTSSAVIHPPPHALADDQDQAHADDPQADHRPW